jgi:hypothetical protein
MIDLLPLCLYLGIAGWSLLRSLSRGQVSLTLFVGTGIFKSLVGHTARSSAHHRTLGSRRTNLNVTDSQDMANRQSNCSATGYPIPKDYPSRS